MEALLTNLKIRISDKIYIKDPESSDLGRKILKNSIELLDELGFEQFTFKKLGARINSPESSVYRYFENKHKLLLYLTNWYWGWIEYKLVIETYGIPEPALKLKKAIEVVADEVNIDNRFDHINEILLHNIVVFDSRKIFLTKDVDQENTEGHFMFYKQLAKRLTDIVQDADPEYKYAKTLVTIILEETMNQQFLKKHFPTITDCNENVSVTEVLTHMVFNNLNINNE
ncbi:TetR/AcrR family transcriptional regulator [Robertkochia solimangrovi]|uniref:TetR/AcrR family transcriptional regulator n=1 Tax=Robertkochia solimangrovi TaxID=2213046 RepID=UPI00117FFE55|nr:TetR/AcrR family transcriptional regulator [Robertkochia solimangrovi]TRZ41409.1 TetR/AcrR family transcriptional regulator [Robertkochia solimangrovi]